MIWQDAGSVVAVRKDPSPRFAESAEQNGERIPRKIRALNPRTKKKHSTFSERINGKPSALNVECWLLNVFRVCGEGRGEVLVTPSLLEIEPFAA
jgi:hypothetical protein